MRALLSVYDKTGITDLASHLHGMGWEIVSSGGTSVAIRDAGIPVLTVEEVTGSPEMLDGRVKTLHPKIHGGLLARRDVADHMRQLDTHGITPIDMLVSNLYPFEDTVQRDGATDQDIIENIDIGGPAMVRAAAKNFASVIVVTDPRDYSAVINHLKAGDITIEGRRSLAAKAFDHVSRYDAIIAAYLHETGDGVRFPDELAIGLKATKTPKYGENAHQAARAYARLAAGKPVHGILDAELLKGEDLSFNNYLDADAAWNVGQLFDRPTVAIIKHTVPCGLAVRDTVVDAWHAAYEGDTISAFGGIVALNRPVDLGTAKEMRKLKLDMIIAPGFDDDAFALLKKKKGTRILKLANRREPRTPELDVRPIAGGMLVQEPDLQQETVDDWKLVTTTSATVDQVRDLEFAWRVIPAIKSNAILLVRDQAIVGLGAGQPNRLESVAIATRKAGDKAQGAVMASDAFFPFPDGIQAGIDAGVKAVIQPGGSLNDQMVIDAANDAGIAMYFTGRRHFRH